MVVIGDSSLDSQSSEDQPVALTLWCINIIDIDNEFSSESAPDVETSRSPNCFGNQYPSCYHPWKGDCNKEPKGSYSPMTYI